MVSEPIHLVQVINQQSPSLVGRNSDAIQIYLFAAIVSSQSDEIALVGNYVIELVLTEKAAKCRV